MLQGWSGLFFFFTLNSNLHHREDPWGIYRFSAFESLEILDFRVRGHINIFGKFSFCHGIFAPLISSSLVHMKRRVALSVLIQFKVTHSVLLHYCQPFKQTTYLDMSCHSCMASGNLQKQTCVFSSKRKVMFIFCR